MIALSKFSSQPQGPIFQRFRPRKGEQIHHNGNIYWKNFMQQYKAHINRAIFNKLKTHLYFILAKFPASLCICQFCLLFLLSSFPDVILCEHFLNVSCDNHEVFAFPPDTGDSLSHEVKEVLLQCLVFIRALLVARLEVGQREVACRVQLIF